MQKIAQLFEEHRKKNLTEVDEEDIAIVFNDMRQGIIKKTNGEIYISVADYVKAFKAFWHWWQRVNRKKNKDIKDIAIDLDTTQSKKPDFCYFTIEELKQLCNKAKYEYKVLMWFLFDSGIRSPTELMNVKVRDISEKEGFVWLNIREETAKTFGRRFKLMLSHEHIKGYIKDFKLQDEDFLFTKSPNKVNEYLKRLAEKVFGEKTTLGRKKFSDLTMYDFRHSSCCYWLSRYKSVPALMYRFGWKKPDMMYYYSELLGMKDTISEEDMLVDMEEKTRLQKGLETEKQQRSIMGEQMEAMKKQIDDLKMLVLKQQDKEEDLRIEAIMSENKEQIEKALKEYEDDKKRKQNQAFKEHIIQMKKDGKSNKDIAEYLKTKLK